jgi:hypothetical protein
MRTRAYRFSGEHPAFPAQWFYGLLRALLGEPGSFATIVRRSFVLRLGASVGRQDHTTSPSASATFVFVTSASTASHRAFRDDREPPLLSGETGGFKSLICPTLKAIYFSQQDWTTQITLESLGKIVFW